MAAIGIAIVALTGPAFDQSVHAGPVTKVLFADESCTFLPERPAPGWVNKRPSTSDFVGVGSAPRMANPTEQIQAAEQNARAALAAEISVTVKETITQILCEGQLCQDNAGLSRDTMTQVDSLATQVVDQTLEGSRIEERFLDRSNCLVHAMASISKAAVEENKKKLIEKIRKLFRFKQLMLLDRSDAQNEMSTTTRGHLDALFKQIGNRLVAADGTHSVCADDPGQPPCKDPADTIYAGYQVVLEKEAATAEFKRRIYKLSGNVRFKDRMIATFNVACQGTGKLGQDYLIDQQAAKSCFEKAKPIIEKGMEGSE